MRRGHWVGVGATQWAESRHRAEGQTDRQRGLYLRSSVSHDGGRAMGEGGISHHESSKKARDGVEMASRGGPHAPPSLEEAGRQQGVGAPHSTITASWCLWPPSLSLPCSPRIPSHSVLCHQPSIISVLRPPCFPGGPCAQPHSQSPHPHRAA